jgi:hypothetical protein
MNTMTPAQATGTISHGAAANEWRYSFTGALLTLLQYVRPMHEELQFISKQDVEAKPAGALSNVVRMLTESHEEREARAEAAYLAEATDLYDLEYRSRECDRQRRSNGR